MHLNRHYELAISDCNHECYSCRVLEENPSWDCYNVSVTRNYTISIEKVNIISGQSHIHENADHGCTNVVLCVSLNVRAYIVSFYFIIVPGNYISL